MVPPKTKLALIFVIFRLHYFYGQIYCIMTTNLLNKNYITNIVSFLNNRCLKTVIFMCMFLSIKLKREDGTNLLFDNLMIESPWKKYWLVHNRQSVVRYYDTFSFHFISKNLKPRQTEWQSTNKLNIALLLKRSKFIVDMQWSMREKKRVHWGWFVHIAYYDYYFFDGSTQ